MKSYIRALQQGSDLDDTVEEKLLIGDRPKLSNDPENKIPLKDRLVSRNDEERKDVRINARDLCWDAHCPWIQLSAPECGLYDFSVALADWLGPHHDFIRPPADEVLAQASKLNEAKTGRPLKGYAPSAGSNGHAKKDEEAPAVKDSPSYASKFFDGSQRFIIWEYPWWHTNLSPDMASSFEDAVERQSACEALHVATITQEVRVSFGFCVSPVTYVRFAGPSYLGHRDLEVQVTVNSQDAQAG
jgi:N-terminal acetyltransferase B complex non-catalytic subunit